MSDMVKEDMYQKNRLNQHIEELQYKLKHVTEVLNKVVEQKDEVSFSRTSLSLSYHERHNSTKPRFERSLSRDSPLFANNKSFVHNFENLPKVKGVVEKYDSVSYVLEMDENPDIIANRIVRRSFRNAHSPKLNKSTSNKRPRIKMNSSSSGGDAVDLIDDWDQTIHPNFNSTAHKLDIDENHDLEIELPTLPSEIGNKDDLELLPEPKHLAAENITSESNSEDESSSTGNL